MNTPDLFVIEDNVPLSRRGAGNELSNQFLEKIKSLPVDNKTSIVISLTLAPTKKEAVSMINGVRNVIKRLPKKDPNSKIAIAAKSFKDAKGKYVCTRVWRLQ